MGRKAKDASQKKIGEWIGVYRNVSKTQTKTTTIESENANASDENRTPSGVQLAKQTNAMRSCTVRLEKLRMPVKQVETVDRIPAKRFATTEVVTKATEKIYDYSFDGDSDGIPLQSGNDGAMKDLIDKLAKENRIEVKKYRPKIVKMKKTDEQTASKKAIAQKRHREKKIIDAEPPLKKPNLRNRIVDAVNQKNASGSSNVVAKNPKQKIGISPSDTNVSEKVVTIESNAIASRPNAINDENINAQPRLQNRNLSNKLQSATFKSSTPLGTKSTLKSKENDHVGNSLFFVSPVMNSTKSTRSNLVKHRLQLSAISDNQEASTSASHNTAAQQPIDFDNDDFDFGDDVMDEPVHSEMNKENSLDVPGATVAALQYDSTSRPRVTSTSSGPSRAASDHNNTAASSAMQNRAGASAVASTSSESNRTAVNTTPRNTNDYSIFEMQNASSDYNIFSPTKRRVYGRSPLKNITSEVNNTNSPSFESLKSITSIPQGFGSLAKSTLNSIQANDTSADINIMLPEGSYFSSRRAADDFDRSISKFNFIDDCFGFDVGDDEEIDNNNDTLTTNSKRANTQPNDDAELQAEKLPLNHIRARLKRFLHNPDCTDRTVKKSKPDNMAKLKKKRVRSPVKSPAKSVNSPAKWNVVFGDGAKQKDIRGAFAETAIGKHSPRKDGFESNAPITLFSEIETVQDRRRSYSRPQRQRKRRISIDTDESEEEQHSENEDFDVDGKTGKRTKRRKKTTQANPKELEELEEFAKKTNAHFDVVDSFELIVE